MTTSEIWMWILFIVGLIMVIVGFILYGVQKRIDWWTWLLWILGGVFIIIALIWWLAYDKKTKKIKMNKVRLTDDCVEMQTMQTMQTTQTTQQPKSILRPSQITPPESTVSMTPLYTPVTEKSKSETFIYPAESSGVIVTGNAPSGTVINIQVPKKEETKIITTSSMPSMTAEPLLPRRVTTVRDVPGLGTTTPRKSRVTFEG